MKTNRKFFPLAARLMACCLVCVMAIGVAGCFSTVRMPFNGDITFHGITITIPTSFIRDSTQSNSNLWVFEKGRYSQWIILRRTAAKEDVDTMLDDYVGYMTEQEANSYRGSFLQKPAVFSTFTRQDQFAQEVLFVENGFCYAISLRGGTEEEFQALLDTVGFPETDQSEKALALRLLF